jgi:predicted O-methyltransferase YrrM
LTSFAFSCVVDDDPVLVAQAAIWLTCLKERQGVRPEDIFAHITQLSNIEFVDWLHRQRVNVVGIEPFDKRRPHCNKIQQLPTFARCKYDQIVLMDCDTAWIGDRVLPCGEPVSATIVREPNPPAPVLAEIFAQTGLGEPEWSPVFFPEPETALTDANNCNGGLYIIRQDFVETLETKWRVWAEWSLSREELFKTWAVHIDQVSFALAMREAGVQVRHLDLVWNYPTNAPEDRAPDLAPQILHYHRKIAANGRVKTIGRPNVDAAITSLNELIATMETDPDLPRTFAELRPALEGSASSAATPAPAEFPLISTIVLNWNRAPLLRQCLESYAATVTGPAEIVVVDNASTDGSRDVIAEAHGFLPGLRAVFLDENIGGEAVNHCLDMVSGELIHISENDQIFLPGWAEHVRTSFDRFPDLGRLSLFSPVPTDREAWHAKPARLRFSRGNILYEARGYPGTSSVLRATLVRDHGVRLYNTAQRTADDFKFPDDHRLNEDVKQAGFWNGWSDRYYVRNLGHELAEFSRDRNYYEKNAASKPDLGIKGWERNMAELLDRPPVRRHSVVFPEADNVQPEIATPAVRGKPARLWSMFDAFTAEVEVLDFLYALTRMTKPQRILETGTWVGRSAIAFAGALRDNGFGHLDTTELNRESAKTAAKSIEAAGLAPFVSIHIGNSLEFSTRDRYEMALFDSDIPLRTAEFRRFYDRLDTGAIILFHDTAEHRAGAADGVRDLMTMGMLEGIFLPTPRGIFLGRVVNPHRPEQCGVLRQLPYGFSSEGYLAANPDVAAAGAEPGDHYRRYGWAEGRKLAPHWSLDGIRLILAVTPGRSGTDYLSELLKAVPGIYSAHEPEPKFSDVMRAAQYDAAVAQRFLLSQKLPAIRRCAQSTYIETSHLACKGFIEPLVDNGCPPDLIILKRDPFLVATSLYLLATIPGRTPLGNQFLLRPDDPSVVPLDGWLDLSDWALCFWYCREIERRMEVYTKIMQDRGRQVMATSIVRLQTDDGIRELLEFVGAGDSVLNDPDFVRRRGEKINHKSEMKRVGSTRLSAAEMINWAKDVDTRLAARRS